MSSGDQVWELIAFFAAVVIFIPIFYKLRVNSILAFIVAGVVLGPHMLGLIKNTGVVEEVGEIGLLFLMFSIGLDLSFRRFKIMRLYIFGFGLAQMVLTALVFGLAAYLMHRTLNEAILIGLALSMSSTAVALRLMSGRNDKHTAAGRATIGILLMQDLAVIPTMIILPKLSNPESLGTLHDLSQSFLQTLGAMMVIITTGRLLIKPLFKIVAATKNSDAFTSVIFLTFLATAWATSAAGMSVSLGAFLAGMLIAETDFCHEVEAEIASFSSLLLGVFFLSVGMMIDLSYVITHIPQILLLTVGVMLVKAFVIFVVETQFKVARSGAMASGVLLCQASEFGFVLFSLALTTNIMNSKTSAILQSVIALSMALSPFLCSFVFKKIDERENKAQAVKDAAAPENLKQPADDDENTQEDHIIVVGYGRVGQATVRMLTRNDLKAFVIDTDTSHLDRARKNNRACLFGSAANEKVLSAAGLDKAKAVVICISGLASAIRVLKAVREMDAKVPVFIRCNDDTRWAELTKLGATGVISETQECGIRLAAATILLNGGDDVRVRETAAILRQENVINPPLPTGEAV